VMLPLKSSADSIVPCFVAMESAADAVASIGDATNSREVFAESTTLG
jgi:hypothetical protein